MRGTGTWGTRLYIDAGHTKINSVAICSRLGFSSAKCPRLSFGLHVLPSLYQFVTF